MSIFKFLVPGRAASGNGGSAAACVIDTTSFSRTRRGRERLAPREQIDMLHKFAKFSSDENIDVTAVFEGVALRKVGHGEEFKGVTVLFCEDQDAYADLIQKTARKAQAAVVTEDKAIEQQVADSGCVTLRASTLRRAIPGGSDGSGGPGKSSRRRRSQRGRKSGPRKDKKSESTPEEGSSDKNGGNQEKGVEQLIDLVD